MMLCIGGISLLIKLLQLQDTDVQEAAVHALSVVTTANDYNCRCVIILHIFTIFKPIFFHVYYSLRQFLKCSQSNCLVYVHCNLVRQCASRVQVCVFSNSD